MNYLPLLLLLVLLAVGDTSRRKRHYYHADMRLTMPALVTRHGYPVETHNVTSSDGYIQTLHRIPRGKTGLEADSRRIPVLIHHALLCSSVDWIILGPGKGLGYMLADAGYDVWLANARGNTYSRGHVTKQTRDPEYWLFSWHEIGVNDLPAAIDHILHTTGHDQLFYIGHSMGSTAFFVMMSEHPEYNDKVRALVGLGPVAKFFSPPENDFVEMTQGVGEETIGTFANMLRMHEFLPRKGWLNSLGQRICQDGMITQAWCVSFMEFMCGKSNQTNLSLLPIFFSHTPAGASSRQLLHFAQQIASGEFRQYDHGLERNMEIYGTPEPPEYSLNNTRIPVALFYSDNDSLSTSKNVEKLSEILPNVIGRYRVPHDSFNHLDFMWGKDVNTLLYSQIIDILHQH